MNARRALAFSALDRYASLCLTIASTVVLARLLTPAQMGVFAVAMGLLSVMNSLRDLGAGRYLLRDQEPTEETIRAVWTVMLGLGVLFAICVAALAWPASRFFGEPDIKGVFFVLALNYLVTPFGAITYAWLMRDMRFEQLAQMRLAGTVVNAAVAIVLAWRGHGAISLAWANLAGSLAQASVALLHRPAHLPWKPGLAGIGRVLSFGGQISGGSLAGSLAASLPEMILTRLHGAAAAGFFSRANGLLELFNRLVSDVVTAVSGPLFARKVRQGESIDDLFVRSIAYTTVLAWSFSLGVAALAFPIVRLLYGDQWLPSVDVVRWLALGFALGAPALLAPGLLLAFNEGRQHLTASLANLALVALGAVAGAQHGLVEAAVGVAIAAGLGRLIWLQLVMRRAGLPWRQLVDGMGRSALVALCCNVPMVLSLWLYGATPNERLLPILVAAVPATLLLPLLLALFRHPLAEELRPLAQRVHGLWKVW